MFCPVCWKEYPEGMLTCDGCSAELVKELSKEHEGHKHEHPSPEETGGSGDTEPKK